MVAPNFWPEIIHILILSHTCHTIHTLTSRLHYHPLYLKIVLPDDELYLPRLPCLTVNRWSDSSVGYFPRIEHWIPLNHNLTHRNNIQSSISIYYRLQSIQKIRESSGIPTSYLMGGRNVQRDECCWKMILVWLYSYLLYCRIWNECEPKM